MLFLGNLFYYLAESFKSNQNLGVAFLIFGRMIFGIGGSRLMTRKYLAINIEVWAQTKYSAIFVLMSSLGQTFGPGLSSILSFVPKTEIGNTTMTEYNIISFFFVIIWGLFFILFFIFFKGHDKENNEENIRKIEYEEYIYNKRELVLDPKIDNKIKEITKTMAKEEEYILSSFAKVDLKNNSNSSKYTYKYKKKSHVPFLKVYFPNSITVFTLLCFMLFKMLQEAWFTELPKMALFYYSNSSVFIGWFLLASTIYTVPVSIFAQIAKKYSDRKILIFSFIIFIISVILKINFTYNGKQNIVKFYLGSSLLFCGSLIGEAASMAILAKVISPTLKRGFLNAGLLSGTGDTTARALGNSSYTLFVYLGGQRVYSFWWYLTALVLLVCFFLVTLYVLDLLQKFTIIKIFTDKSNNDFEVFIGDRLNTIKNLKS